MGPVFQKFPEENALCLPNRFPLEILFDAKRLEEVARKTSLQYRWDFLFSQAIAMILSLDFRVPALVHVAFHGLKEERGVCDKIISLKTPKLYKGVSGSVISDSAKQMNPIINAFQSRHQACVLSYKAKVKDGNHLAAIERRVKELRTKTSGQLLETVFAADEQEADLVTKVFLIRDSHAQERSVLDEVLLTVETKALLKAERNFCTKDFLKGIVKGNGFYVVHQHGGLLGTDVGIGSAEVQVEGGKVSEGDDRLSQGETGFGVRRITLVLSEETRDRDKLMYLLTNLPDEIPGAMIAEVYRKRWTIARRFYEVAQTLNFEPNTQGYPQAALFAFCLALIVSNALALIKASLCAVHNSQAPEKMCHYHMARQIQEILAGMLVVLPPKNCMIYGQMEPVEFAGIPRQAAMNVKSENFKKAKHGPKKKPTRMKEIKYIAHFNL